MISETQLMCSQRIKLQRQTDILTGGWYKGAWGPQSSPSQFKLNTLPGVFQFSIIKRVYKREDQKGQMPRVSQIMRLYF